ncbi:MAG: hypothetical protein OEW97_08140 [Gammaproteobacteria bacterium]|nr:hypothetical protein [Gammaproteobacteria bacterium]
MLKSKWVIIILLFISVYSDGSVAQNGIRKSFDSLYYLGYGGLLTVGYQRLLHERVGLNVSAASIALLHEDLRDGFAFPVHLSFYPVGGEHRMFLDLGVSFITKGKSNPLFDFYDGFNRPYIVGVGYNYHAYDNGLFVKLGVGNFIYEPKSHPGTLTSGVIYAFSWGSSF